MIYVQQEQAERSLITQRTRDLALQLAFEAATIGEARQVIRKGRLLAGIQIALEIQERAHTREQQINIERVCNVAERADLCAAPGILRLAARGSLNNDRNKPR